VGRGKIQLAAFDSLSLKPPLQTRKFRRYFFYKSRDIADFVLHFVAMATKIGQGKILLPVFDGLIRKLSYRGKNRVRDYFVLNFVAMATRIGRDNAKISHISLTQHYQL